MVRIRRSDRKKILRIHNDRHSLNIRNYVGDNKTNKGIRETALDTPGQFFFYNNGISAIASKISVNEQGTGIICEQLSIINGAQTVRSLNKAYSANAAKTNDAHVLVRVTETSLGEGSSEQSFLGNITRFNNTQNAIKVSDFFSNDVVQSSLAKRFGNLAFAGKKYWYKNKRSGEQRKSSIPIGMEEFANTLHAFQFGPTDVFGGTSYLFDQSRDKGYVRVFGDGSEAYTSLDDETFNRLAGIWFICESIYDEWKLNRERVSAEEAEEAKRRSDPSEPVSRLALERRWLVYFAVGEYMRQVSRFRSANLEIALGRFAKPQFALEDGAALVKAYVGPACEVLIRLYRAASKSPDFTHRNWFRDSRTLRDIENDIAGSKSWFKHLPELAKKA